MEDTYAWGHFLTFFNLFSIWLWIYLIKAFEGNSSVSVSEDIPSTRKGKEMSPKIKKNIPQTWRCDTKPLKVKNTEVKVVCLLVLD